MVESAKRFTEVATVELEIKLILIMVGMNARKVRNKNILKNSKLQVQTTFQRLNQEMIHVNRLLNLFMVHADVVEAVGERILVRNAIPVDQQAVK